MTSTKFIAAHSSGRFDRSTESLAKSVGQIRKTKKRFAKNLRQTILISGTEVAARSPEELKSVLDSPGWSYVHLEGRGPSECWITWNNKFLSPIGSARAVKLSDKTWVRSPEYGGKAAAKVHALVQKFEFVGLPKNAHLLFVVIHMPLDNSELRQEIWMDCAKSLRTLVEAERSKDLGLDVLLVADWNRNAKSPSERKLLQTQLASPLKLKQAWQKPYPKSGTHGRALIDGSIGTARLFGRLKPYAWLLPDDVSSDHRPYGYKLNSSKKRK